jgi:methionyl-tRNA synthetase
MKKFYITTPIYYVNDKPHVGHAYTTLVADVFARYYRNTLGGENVFFLTGTDEHGQKIAEAAVTAGKSPQEFTDEVAGQFQKAWELLNISHDHFFRTTDKRHINLVQEILQSLYDNGYIYKGAYKGLYCVGCERYILPDEADENRCPLHPNKTLDEREEENYFLKLSELAPEVLRMLEEDRYRVLPVEKKNEILAKVRAGVKDISISRTGVPWGIPLPWDQEHTVYVWIDALFNYYTATKFLSGREHFWPADVHLLAKDILWFHAFIWEALLHAVGLELPKIVFAHGFFTVDGQKMSKSIGNVIDPAMLVERYGVDGARYLLVSAFPFGNDGDISLARFDEKYNADLANGIGNLASRVAKLCEKVGLGGFSMSDAEEVDGRIAEAFARVSPDEALSYIWERVTELDKRINEDAPWKLEGKSLSEVLRMYVCRLIGIARDCSPFMPLSSQRLIDVFTADAITKPDGLFARLEKKTQ